VYSKTVYPNHNPITPLIYLSYWGNKSMSQL